MSIDTKTIGISPEVFANMQDAAENAAKGIRDSEEVNRGRRPAVKGDIHCWETGNPRRFSVPGTSCRLAVSGPSAARPVAAQSLAFHSRRDGLARFVGADPLEAVG